MSVVPGSRFGPYEMLSAVGAGGMGEVYRARDAKLNRDVALKVLPEAFVLDADRVARFKREAQVLASLNHPNIATIHGFEEATGRQALVMELVEGETLDQRIRSARRGGGRVTGRGSGGGLRVDDALRIARQIADALDAAHERGIVHRDVKPTNIKVTRDGLVKVLDFGLAKLSPARDTMEATITDDGTHQGVVLGTAAYMSPEQARGLAVDKRTDIWAFGCVLYEMLSGSTAFGRATTTDTLAAIVERDPDWTLLPAETPPEVRRILSRCLEKDPQRRMRDIGDVGIALADVATAPEQIGAQKPGGLWVPRWTTVGAVVLMFSGAAATWILSRQDSSRGAGAQRAVHFDIVFDRADLAPGVLPRPSPDGRHFVFAGTAQDRRHVWIHSVDSGESRALAGTEDAVGPIWSADGRWIAFYADGRIKKVSAAGGAPQTIALSRGFQDAAWGSRGDIIFRPTNREPLFRIHESGGSPEQLTRLDRALTENSHRGVFFLPDGRHFLFTNRCERREHNALFIASLDVPGVRRVMPLQSNARYIPPRHGTVGTLLYYRDGGLVAQRFDTEAVTLVGDAVVVLDRIAYNAAGIAASFDASADGTVIIWDRPAAHALRLTWFNRKGEAVGTTGPAGDYGQPRLSPLGDRVAFSRADAQTGNRDVWYTEIRRGVSARLTTDGANDWYPQWSPDAKRLVFSSDRDLAIPSGAGGSLFVKSAMDPGRDETIFAKPPQGDSGVYDWSRDGAWITFGSRDIWIAPTSGKGKLFSFLATKFNEGGGRFSPDGTWIAYTSDETGRFEVYVRPFTGDPAGNEAKLQVSNAGGEYPVWRSDGHELFYLSGPVNDISVYAVDMRDLKRSRGLLPAVRLFRACPDTSTPSALSGAPWNYFYDTIDGQRFLVNCREQRPGRLGVVLNWTMPGS